MFKLCRCVECNNIIGEIQGDNASYRYHCRSKNTGRVDKPVCDTWNLVMITDGEVEVLKVPPPKINKIGG